MRARSIPALCAISFDKVIKLMEEKNEKQQVICEQCQCNWSELLGEYEEIARSFNVCGKCGAFLPHTKQVVERYFDLMLVNHRLSGAVRLALKGETASAVREATVMLETVVKKKSGLNAIGVNLMDQAFSFDFDRRTNSITRPPLIQLNNLSTESKRNEQDGIRLLTMGVMRGIRNIFAHTKGTSKFYYCLNIITTIDMLIEQIKGEYGTIAEARDTFDIKIPDEHVNHDFREINSSSKKRVSSYFCETCSIAFNAKWEVIIED